MKNQSQNTTNLNKHVDEAELENLKRNAANFHNEKQARDAEKRKIVSKITNNIRFN